MRTGVLLLALMVPALATADKTDKTPPVGDYVCKMENGYKLRPCTVVQNGPVKKLVVRGEKRLIEMEAELRPMKGKVYLSGKLTGKRPFPCFRCAERCTTNPESCGCTETTSDQQTQCLAQPIVSVLKKSGKTWTGTYPIKIYYGHTKDGKEWVEVDQYKITIKRAR